jgi:hypothetical protein
MNKGLATALWVAGGIVVSLFWLRVIHGFVGGILLTLTVIVAIIGALLTWTEA